MRAKCGPRDRNYNETLEGDVTYTVYRAGSLYSFNTFRREHRQARLQVNNPYRASKPRGLEPTERNLRHHIRKAPVVDWQSAQVPFAEFPPSIGWSSRYQGPHTDAMYDEWNARYLTPTWGEYDEQLRTEAVLEALTRLKDQKWNAGVALAESQGVAEMATDALALVVRTREALRKGDFKDAYTKFRGKIAGNHRLKAEVLDYPAWRRKYWQDVRHAESVRRSAKIPKGWLYYNFAIAPTLADISDAADAHQTKLADLLYGETPFVSGYARQTYRDSIMRAGHFRCDFSALRSVRVKIGVRPRNFVLAKMSELGLTNLPEAAYNRMPFSWVFDYFSTLGEWLSALDSSVGWHLSDSWEECWRIKASTIITPVSTDLDHFTWPLDRGFIKHKDVTRDIRTDLYGPMGSILPTFNRRVPSLKKFTNLLSVLSLMGKVPRA